jgi:hypothetical protein
MFSSFIKVVNNENCYGIISICRTNGNTPVIIEALLVEVLQGSLVE